MLFPKKDPAPNPLLLPKAAPRGTKAQAPLLTYPYTGTRSFFFVYHPYYHGPTTNEAAFPQALDRFMRMFNDFCSVTDLYNDEAVVSETVGGAGWQKEVRKLLASIEADGKDPYQLESLALCLFDYEPGEKNQQRMLPYHKELQDSAAEIRAADLGLRSSIKIGGHNIVKHGWAG